MLTGSEQADRSRTRLRPDFCRVNGIAGLSSRVTAMPHERDRRLRQGRCHRDDRRAQVAAAGSRANLRVSVQRCAGLAAGSLEDAVEETAAGVGSKCARGLRRLGRARWCSPTAGVEGLVRLGGKRRWRRLAGRIDASSVAFRGSTPDPATAIQAVTGSGLEAAQVRGNHSLKRHIL